MNGFDMISERRLYGWLGIGHGLGPLFRSIYVIIGFAVLCYHNGLGFTQAQQDSTRHIETAETGIASIKSGMKKPNKTIDTVPNPYKRDWLLQGLLMWIITKVGMLELFFRLEENG
uniref:Uncharacterized protein n=1 Tax=Glossina austeni TaxID=7395 RepID=A0A1A9VJF3_GLOAU